MRNTGSAWTPSTITGGSCLVIQPLWQRLEEAVLETNLGAEDDRNSEACLKMSQDAEDAMFYDTKRHFRRGPRCPPLSARQLIPWLFMGPPGSPRVGKRVEDELAPEFGGIDGEARMPTT